MVIPLRRCSLISNTAAVDLGPFLGTLGWMVPVTPRLNVYDLVLATYEAVAVWT